MAHYYDENDTGDYRTRQINHVIDGRSLVFKTADGVFAKDKIDFGSHFLIDVLLAEPLSSVRLFDIGCGYGAIGITLALLRDDWTVDMIDVNRRALSLALENSAYYNLTARTRVCHRSDFVEQPNGYDVVVTNPPIRAGKATVFDIYRLAQRNLKPGGALYVVIQKKQGAPSSRQYLTDLFGNCQLFKKRAGYYLLKSIK